jgi:hypothetical protein
MIDLHHYEFSYEVLDSLCKQVRSDAQTLIDKESYYLPGVCAGGKIIPLSEMNSAYPVVFLLQLVLGIKK